MEDNNPTESGTFEIYNSAEELQASMAQSEAAPAEAPPEPQAPVEEPAAVETQEAPIQESPVVEADSAPAEPQQETYTEPVLEQEQAVAGEEYSDQEIEGAVMQFLSEKLGRDINSFDDLAPVLEPASPLDERIEAISKFVQETGRSPQDWFTYQSLNPSEMDDMMAVRVSMATDYKDLDSQEIELLLKSKYKLDTSLYTDDEVKLSQLQLKMDAAKSREKISGLRETYRAPEVDQQSQEIESIVDDEWIANMRESVSGIEGLEFSLGQDTSFTFGLDDNYKSQLMDKNARLDEYFDPYIRDDGSWDVDTLSSHRALIDNIDSIAQSIYRKGLSDGQRSLVDKAANVQANTPQEQKTDNQDPVMAQIRQYMMG